MTDDFDLVVLGTGSAGSSVAHRCRAAGWPVAIADDLGRLISAYPSGGSNIASMLT